MLTKFAFQAAVCFIAATAAFGQEHNDPKTDMIVTGGAMISQDQRDNNEAEKGFVAGVENLKLFPIYRGKDDNDLFVPMEIGFAAELVDGEAYVNHYIVKLARWQWF